MQKTIWKGFLDYKLNQKYQFCNPTKKSAAILFIKKKKKKIWLEKEKVR